MDQLHIKKDHKRFHNHEAYVIQDDPYYMFIYIYPSELRRIYLSHASAHE